MDFGVNEYPLIKSWTISENVEIWNAHRKYLNHYDMLGIPILYLD